MDKWNINAQSALEFMVLTGITILVFILMMGIAAYYLHTLGNAKTTIAGEDIAITIQKEIQLAARVHDGYFHTFLLPKKAAGREYNISVQQNELTIILAGTDYTRIIPPIQGSIKKGKNIITKNGGVITLNGN